MATKNLNSRISWKKDTAANWSTNNPVLLDGEIIIVETASGEERFKIGDGTSHFNELPFQDEAVRNQIENNSKYPVPSGQTPTQLQQKVTELSESSGFNPSYLEQTIIKTSDSVLLSSNEHRDPMMVLGYEYISTAGSMLVFNTNLSEWGYDNIGPGLLDELTNDPLPWRVGEPTESAHATPKSYVDTQVGNMMPKAGGTFTGNVNGTATQVKNVGMFRNIFIVDGTPDNSMGADGDLCFSL